MKVKRADQLKKLLKVPISLIFITIALILIFPPNFYRGISSGLDASWQISLQLAWQNGFVFGRDFLFTYGPLGLLSTRYAFPEVSNLYFFSDFFLFSLILFSFLIILKKSDYSVIRAAALIILSCSIPYFWNGIELSVTLLFLSMFFFLHSMKVSRFAVLYITLSCFLSVYSFYVKLNTGLFSGLVIIISLTLLLSSKEKKNFALKSLGILFGLYLISFIYMPVDVLLYLKGGWYIASAYSEAMVIPVANHPEVFSLSIIFISCLLFSCFFSITKIFSSKENFILIFWLNATLFLLFKQSFVRADEHVFAFLNWMAIPVGIAFVFSDKSLNKGLRYLFILSLGFSFSVSRDRLQYIAFLSRLDGIKNYFVEAGYSEEEAISKTTSPYAPLFRPETMNVIGNSTVDIIPVDIEHLYFEKKNYAPRPVMQSYSAYHPYLDALNASKYESISSPQFVLFKIGAVDNRYSFFDESKTKQTLLTHFSPVLRDGEYTLLQKRNPKDFIKKEIISTERRAFHEAIPVNKKRELLYARFELKYSLLGELAKMFYQPPVPKIIFKMEDGTREEFRAVTSIIKDDVLVSKFINTQDDAENYFKRNFSTLKNVKEIKISSNGDWAFKPRFTVVLSEGKLVPINGE